MACCLFGNFWNQCWIVFFSVEFQLNFIQNKTIFIQENYGFEDFVSKISVVIEGWRSYNHIPLKFIISVAYWCHMAAKNLVKIVSDDGLLSSHQDITWTNVDLSSGKSCGIHLTANSQEMLKISILDVSLKVTNSVLQSHPLGTNELTTHDGKIPR